MSDSKSSYGEPVEEPRPVDDVVGSAHEGIADAEAAGRDAVDVGPDRRARAARRGRIRPVVERRPRRRRADSSTSDPAFDSAMYEAHADDAATDGTARSRRRDRVVARADRRRRRRRRQRSTPSEPVGETAVVRRGRRRRAPRRLRHAAADLRPGARGAASARQPRRRRRDRPARRALRSPSLYLAVWLGIGLLSGEVTVDDDRLARRSPPSAPGRCGCRSSCSSSPSGCSARSSTAVAGAPGSSSASSSASPPTSATSSVRSSRRRSGCSPRARARRSSRRSCSRRSRSRRSSSVVSSRSGSARGWPRAAARVTELNIEAQREYERTLEAGPQLTRV